MAPLSPAAESRLLLLGLGVASCVLFSAIRYMLIEFRDSVEVKPIPKTQYITQGTEDSIKDSTLETLLDGHNYSMKDISARIITDRALHYGATLDALLWEVTRPDHERRETAMRAVALLTTQFGMEQLNQRKVYSAVVKSLQYSVTDYTHIPYQKGFDGFEFRDSAERLCLIVLWRLVHSFGVEEVVVAGFVPKWLNKEPLGSTDKERQKNFAEIFKENTLLSAMVTCLVRHPRGLKQLKEVKLVSEDADLFAETINVRMINGESTSGENNIAEEMGLTEGRRLNEQSDEERRLRRRNREAMVLNDGLQPIDVSDIIESRYRSPREERGPILEHQRLQRRPTA